MWYPFESFGHWYFKKRDSTKTNSAIKMMQGGTLDKTKKYIRAKEKRRKNYILL